MTATPDVDLAIVGSGFGASIAAMVARRLGLRVTMIERGRHPRFAIGESASPLAGILIEQLADRYDLPRVRPLSAFGTWQRTYPEIGCGLKRGFTFFKHQPGRCYAAAPDRSNQLLVAASPNDELSDTHWLRADVDHFLLNEAIALGAGYLDETALDELTWTPSGDADLAGVRAGAAIRLRARFVLDASGPRGFLSRALGIRDRGFAGYPATQALFSHFTGVARCADLADFAAPGTPYPMDDAALHHVFDGGWMWVLRFGHGVVSAGVAVDEVLAADLRLADGQPAWERLLARYPSVAAQFADARPVREFTWMPRLPYRAERASGPRWAMLPSAAAFVDPIFSTGIPLTLLGIERLARRLPVLIAGTEDAGADEARMLEDADRTARFVAGAYASFPRFELFGAWSMFYFAAASFSEMARRLASPRTPMAFLCGDDPAFAAALDHLSPAADDAPGWAAAAYAGDVAAAIEDRNVAGLCEAEKRNWYGVDLDDTIRGAAKLGLSADHVRQGLKP